MTYHFKATAGSLIGQHARQGVVKEDPNLMEPAQRAALNQTAIC
jgi:hypothetical protein